MPQNKPLDPRVYFSADTEAAIILYNAATDPNERETLYIDRIAYPLNKLVENVINRFKFPYLLQAQGFEETKRQTVSYLVMNLLKYTQDKGKAFSYFSVIAKNYLILHNNNAYKHQKRVAPLYDSNSSNPSVEEMLSIEAPDERRHDDTHEFVRLLIIYWEEHAERIFRKKRDIDIAMAVVNLMRDADGIENFNKKALYVMIREMTDCKTAYITKVVNKMRDAWADQLREYNEYGTVGKHVMSRR